MPGSGKALPPLPERTRATLAELDRGMLREAKGAKKVTDEEKETHEAVSQFPL